MAGRLAGGRRPSRSRRCSPPIRPSTRCCKVSPKARPICGSWRAAIRSACCGCWAADPDRHLAALLAENGRAVAATADESRGDAAAPPHEGGSGAADRARRYRRRLAGDAGDPRAHRSGRYRGRCRRPLRAGRGRARRAPDAERQSQAAGRQRLHRAGHGQDGRLRAQLFERHRSHRVLRLRGAGRAGGCRAGRAVRAPDAAAGEAAAGAYRRRLRVPHRFAAAARSGLDRNRDLDRGGAVPITRAWGRTGSAPR